MPSWFFSKKFLPRFRLARRENSLVSSRSDTPILLQICAITSAATFRTKTIQSERCVYVCVCVWEVCTVCIICSYIESLNLEWQVCSSRQLDRNISRRLSGLRKPNHQINKSHLEQCSTKQRSYWFGTKLTYQNGASLCRWGNVKATTKS